MKIVYIPGFGGNKNSETYQNIFRKHFETECILYDNRNADKAYFQICEQLDILKNEKVLIIGQSLGGFWAEIFAIKNSWNAILINPSLEPSVSLKKYNLTDIQLKKFESYQDCKTAQSKVSIIISKNDTVVDSKPVVHKYKNQVDFIYIEGGHQLQNFEVLFKEIEKMKLSQS